MTATGVHDPALTKEWSVLAHKQAALGPDARVGGRDRRRLGMGGVLELAGGAHLDDPVRMVIRHQAPVGGADVREVGVMGNTEYMVGIVALRPEMGGADAAEGRAVKPEGIRDILKVNEF